MSNKKERINTGSWKSKNEDSSSFNPNVESISIINKSGFTLKTGATLSHESTLKEYFDGSRMLGFTSDTTSGQHLSENVIFPRNKSGQNNIKCLNENSVQFEDNENKVQRSIISVKRKGVEIETNELSKSNQVMTNNKTPTQIKKSDLNQFSQEVSSTRDKKTNLLLKKPNIHNVNTNLTNSLFIKNENGSCKKFTGGLEDLEIQDESPVLFKDREVEIQFRSPRQKQAVETLYEDDDVVIQFQSPQKSKKLKLYGESLEVERCDSPEIDFALSFSEILSKPTDAKELILENETESTSQSTNFSDDTYSQSQKRIGGINFKKTILALCFKKYQEPDDSDERTEEEIVAPVELKSFGNKELFVTLDNDISNWENFILLVANLCLSPKVFLRGDALRVLFYYILNGPNENIMLDVKEIVFRHLDLHPPNSEVLRNFYKNLLFIPYTGNDFDFPNNITDEGILNHVMGHYEMLYNTDKSTKEEPKTNPDEGKETNSEEIVPLAFELLEERYYNHEPLTDKEFKRAMESLDRIQNFNWDEHDDAKMKQTVSIPRLNIALKLIIQLLQKDFKNCVSKLKHRMKNNSNTTELKPLVQHLTNKGFYSKLLELYFKTDDQELWILFSQLLELMAEQTRIFHSDSKTHWLFPLVDNKCAIFADEFFNLLKNNSWEEEEEQRRLRMLKPPWFQQRVTMALVSDRLNFKMIHDLKGIMDLMHSNITNNVNKENNINEPVAMSNCAVLVNRTSSLKEAITIQKLLKKKNKFGETHLHLLCKQKRPDLPELQWFISLPEVDLNAADHYGWTPLHEAITSKSKATEKTRILLMHKPLFGQKAVDVSVQNKEGVTPLHDAVSSGNLDVCRLLVEKGGYSLLFKHDGQGFTPLHLANKNTEIARYFKQTIETKENMDLSLESTLDLENHLIELLVIACDASMANHDTLELYKLLRLDDTLSDKVDTMDGIVCGKDVLLSYKEDQGNFSKLRKLLRNLARNQNNPKSVLLWNEHINATQV